MDEEYESKRTAMNVDWGGRTVGQKFPRELTWASSLEMCSPP